VLCPPTAADCGCGAIDLVTGCWLGTNGAHAAAREAREEAAAAATVVVVVVCGANDDPGDRTVVTVVLVDVGAAVVVLAVAAVVLVAMASDVAIVVVLFGTVELVEVVDAEHCDAGSVVLVSPRAVPPLNHTAITTAIAAIGRNARTTRPTTRMTQPLREHRPTAAARRIVTVRTTWCQASHNAGHPCVRSRHRL
jgi:hypothetical protein